MMDLNAEYAAYTAAYELGGYAAAEPLAARILSQTDKWWRRGDGTSQVLSAQMRYMLARAALDRGEFAEAQDEIRRGLESVGRARQLKDARYAYEGVMLLLTRGEIESAESRLEDALGTLFVAAQFEDESAHPSWFEAQTHLLLARQWALQGLGRFDESEQAANEALALASQHDPRLVASALERLSMLQRLMGGSGDAQLSAAEAILATHDAPPGDRADLAYNQASVALQRGDHEAAEKYLTEAERAYLELGNVRAAANAAVGYAEIARLRGQHDDAIAASRRAVMRAEEVGEPVLVIEAQTVLGVSLEGAGRLSEALEALDEARTAAGTDRMQLIRVDANRAVMAYNLGVQARNAHTSGSSFGQAAALAGDDHGFELAASISVPAAFAADAVRHDLPPGETRERWTREVSRTLADQALQALTVLGRADEIVDLIEHVAASASAGGGSEPGIELVYGAGSLPPRIRSFPDRDGAIWWAIDAAEERYGVRARADETVTAW